MYFFLMTVHQTNNSECFLHILEDLSELWVLNFHFHHGVNCSLVQPMANTPQALVL